MKDIGKRTRKRGTLPTKVKRRKGKNGVDMQSEITILKIVRKGNL